VDLARGTPRYGGRPTDRLRLGFGARWASVPVLTGSAVVLIEAPAIEEEPFFVGVNTAVVLSLVALGHYLIAQHGERFTGLCFCAAALGWIVTNLDVYPRLGTLPSWLLGGTIVYTSMGLGAVRYGRERLDPPGRRWVIFCFLEIFGTSAAIMLVSRPEWLSYSPDAVWLAPWPNETLSMTLNVLACVGYLAVGGYFARITIQRLRTAAPAQRRVLRPLSLACAAWGGGAALVTSVGALSPATLSIHANSNIVGVLSLGVTAALAASINRSRLVALTFVETLPTDSTPESLSAYARRALSDPTAELLFTVPGKDIVIDATGRLRELPNATMGLRFVQDVVGTGGGRVAVLVGDPLLRDDLSFVRSFAKVLSFVAENQQLHAVLRMRLAQVSALRTAETLAYDRAREQFRRDLHDGVQQTIAAARMDLDGIPDDPSVLPEVDRKLLLALDQIRNLKDGSEPPELALGLRAALDRVVAELRLTATRTIPDEDLGLVTLPVYYLVREALTNAHKHAQGCTVHIVIKLQDGLVEVWISDDGPGGAVDSASGGLAGLRRRVDELGGRFELHSPAGLGTAIRATLPAVPA
jgi:signal transduction histidine kinase